MNRRKKNSRHRGTHTHSWGHKKKHRGAGSRGGRGNAGTGKRGDARKPSRWKTQPVTGKFGFTPARLVKSKSINIAELEDRIVTWVAKKKAEGKEGSYTVDLGKLGYTKLLSRGKVRGKLNVTVPAASQKAVEKISEAGGSVKLPAAKE